MLLASTRGAAQPLGDVVVLPFGAPELDGALASSATLEAELSKAQVSTISLHDARDRFTARSRPPQLASDSDVDVLAREARDAIEHVAFGRTAAAQKSVREVISRAERTLESLNRETATARRILDACLSLVRTTLQGGKRDLALEQATRCRRLVPDLVPNEDAHPANVVGVLAEADNLLRRMRIGHLTVRSAPESNCSVYLNGRHLGATPFHLDRAAAGDYRVQVECGTTVARVHVVQLGDQPVDLLVDTQFDRVIVSDPRLSLRYPSAAAAREQAVSHAAQLGAVVRADDVVLISVDGESAELSRVQVAQRRLVARAVVPWSVGQGFARAGLERAIATLRAARIEGTPTLATGLEVPPPPPSPEPASAILEEREEPAATSSGTPSSSPAPDLAHRPADGAERLRPDRADAAVRRKKAAGYALIGTSAAVFMLGVGYEWRAQRLADQLTRRAFVAPVEANGDDPVDTELERADSSDGELRSLQSAFERAEKLRWLGVGAPLLATIGVVMATAPRAQVPWWGYTLGAVGLALIGGGAAEIATGDRCELYDESRSAPCRRQKDSVARGALLVSAAVPLLALPLVQLAARAQLQSLSLYSESARAGLQLGLRGAF